VEKIYFRRRHFATPPPSQISPYTSYSVVLHGFVAVVSNVDVVVACGKASVGMTGGSPLQLPIVIVFRVEKGSFTTDLRKTEVCHMAKF
jgi:hypothetical protein